jgi:hypothetical protein
VEERRRYVQHASSDSCKWSWLDDSSTVLIFVNQKQRASRKKRKEGGGERGGKTKRGEEEKVRQACRMQIDCGFSEGPEAQRTFNSSVKIRRGS